MGCNEFNKKFQDMDGWDQSSDEREAFTKVFKFSDFKQAFSFMTCVALKAEQINHHPELENIYNKVTVTLTTHDTGGISKLDYEMAIFLENCKKNYI